MTIEVNKENFEQNKSNNNLFVIDVWTTTCTSCKTYSPIFESVSDQHEDVVMGKMDGMVNRDIAAEYSIRSVPTTLFLKGGVLLEKKVGPLTSKELNETINKLKS